MVFWFIIEHTMLPIFFLVVLGYFLDKKFHLDVKTLSKLMFFLVIPSFIFTNIYTTQFPATSINIIAAIAIFMVICFVIANIVGHIRHYDAAMLESCRNAFMFNNTGNLGVALIILVFSHDPFVVRIWPKLWSYRSSSSCSRAFPSTRSASIRPAGAA